MDLTTKDQYGRTLWLSRKKWTFFLTLICVVSYRQRTPSTQQTRTVIVSTNIDKVMRANVTKALHDHQWKKIWHDINEKPNGHQVKRKIDWCSHVLFMEVIYQPTPWTPFYNYIENKPWLFAIISWDLRPPKYGYDRPILDCGQWNGREVKKKYHRPHGHEDLFNVNEC